MCSLYQQLPDDPDPPDGRQQPLDGMGLPEEVWPPLAPFRPNLAPQERFADEWLPFGLSDVLQAARRLCGSSEATACAAILGSLSLCTQFDYRAPYAGSGSTQTYRPVHRGYQRERVAQKHRR